MQETVIKDGGFTCAWRDVRPIPADDDFFENVFEKKLCEQISNIDVDSLSPKEALAYRRFLFLP